MKPRNKIEREVSNYPLEYQSYLTNNVSGPSKLVFQKTTLISIEIDFQEGVFILYVLSKDGKFSDIFR